jgi:hypothetical protein
LQWNTGARPDDRARAGLHASDGRQFEQSRAGAHTAALKSPGAARLHVTDRATDRATDCATKKVKKGASRRTGPGDQSKSLCGFLQAWFFMSRYICAVLSITTNN